MDPDVGYAFRLGRTSVSDERAAAERPPVRRREGREADRREHVMSEQVTMVGQTASSPRIGLGVFALGLVGAFLAGALVVWVLSTQGRDSVTIPAVPEQVAPSVAAPVPAAAPTVRRAPGDEYRRIPDDGGAPGVVTPIPGAGSAPGDEYKRIPDETRAP